MKIKVYCLNEYEWWAGRSWKEVKKDYLELTGAPKEEAFEQPYILPDKMMDELIFNDDNGIKRTFRKQLEKMIKEGWSFPCCFAVSEGY